MSVSGRGSHAILTAPLGGSLTSTLVALIANAGHENQAVATAGPSISAVVSGTMLTRQFTVSYLFRSLGGVVVLSLSMTLTQETLRRHLRERLTGADVEEVGGIHLYTRLLTECLGQPDYQTRPRVTELH